MPSFKLPYLPSKSYLQFKRDPDDEETFVLSDDTSTEKNYGPKDSKWHSSIISSWKLPWLLLALIVSVNITYLLFSPSPQIPWNETDFKYARSVISNKLVQFKSSLDFLDEKGHTYRIYDPEDPVYVGNGTDVDANWKALIMPRYNDIKISREEGESVNGDLYVDTTDDTNIITVEVFHGLHCLNTIRKRVYSHLHPEMLTVDAQIHVDHCIEALREAIMCAGDMTPIPYEWSAGGKQKVPNTANLHYCRDFDQLKAWMVGRHAS